MNKANLKLDMSQEDEAPSPNTSGISKSKTPEKQKTRNLDRGDYVKSPDTLFLNTIDSFIDKIRSKSVLVIEFDQFEIRILQLIRVKDKYNFGYWATQDITHLDLNRNETELLGLRNLIDKKMLISSDVILTLQGPEIIIRTLTAPKLEGNELREAVFWKNKNDLPNLADDSLWDFEIIGEVEEDKKRMNKILSVITHDAFVRKKLKLLSELDIYPKYVIAKPIALSAALKHLTNEWALEEKIAALAEIGTETTLLSFYYNGKLEFVRTVMFGSSKINRALDNPIKLKDKQIKLQPDKIELYKQKHGILLEILENPENTKSLFPYNQLYEFVQPVLQLFVSELKRSFAFYLNSNDHENVNLLFITGSGTKLKNMDKFLQSRLQVPVHTIAPAFPSVVQENYKLGFEYTACFGAGIRKDKKFNFIPKDLLFENKYRSSQKSLLIAVSIIFAIILVYSSFLYFDEQKYVEQVSSMENRYLELHPSEVKYRKIIEEVRAQEKKKQDLIGNVNIDSKMVNVLKVFSNITPSDVALTSIDYYEPGTSTLFEDVKAEESMVIIKGMVYKNFVSADITLIEFMNSLKKLNYFKEITLSEKTKRLKEKIFLFRINCKI